MKTFSPIHCRELRERINTTLAPLAESLGLSIKAGTSNFNQDGAVFSLRVANKDASRGQLPADLKTNAARIEIYDAPRPERDCHENGVQAHVEVIAAIRKAFNGNCCVSHGSYYNDYLAYSIGIINADKAAGEKVRDAVRSVLPNWRSVSVAVHPDSNRVVALAYAHDTISDPAKRCISREAAATGGEA
jgi:hypothetical protein